MEQALYLQASSSMEDSPEGAAAGQHAASVASPSAQPVPTATVPPGLRFPQQQASVPAVTSVIIPPTWDMANKENCELEDQLRRIEGDLEVTDKELGENGDRIGVMSEHLTNVQHELKHTQARLESKTREIKTEDHLKQLSTREAVRDCTS